MAESSRPNERTRLIASGTRNRHMELGDIIVFFGSSQVLTPLPAAPVVQPEVTITPIPAPSTKKDKKKPNKAANKKEEKEKKSKEKKDSKGAQVEVVTVGTTIDEDGNKIWICPACAKPDDGSPMIG